MQKFKRILPFLFTLTIVIGLCWLTNSAVAQEAEAPAHKDEPVTFISIFFHAGPKAVVMWMLLVMSVVMMTFIIEMIIKLRTPKLAPPAVVALLRDAIGQGNYQGAWEICKANPCFLSKVFSSAVENLGNGKHAVDEAIGEAFARESARLKAHNSYLSVIGVVSPMVGLTGTVVGMMQAFAVLGKSGAADMTGLSAAISGVLIATAAGLVVAIPAFMSFYFFKNQANIVFADVYSIVKNLLRSIPVDQLAGFQFGEAAQETAAAQPVA